jgi:hypothetical protein
LLARGLGSLVAGVDRSVVGSRLHAALQRLQDLQMRLNFIELVLLVLRELGGIALTAFGRSCGRGLRADRERARERGANDKNTGTGHYGTSELSLVNECAGVLRRGK